VAAALVGRAEERARTTDEIISDLQEALKAE
jgi:hypothetical protein